MATEIIMPSLGESVFEGKIAAWLKNEGDRVEQYEPVLEIETDKVTTEATAEVAGTLLKILIPEGEIVPVGAVLAIIGQPGEAIDDLVDKIVVTGGDDDDIARKSFQATTPAVPATIRPPSNGPGQHRPRRYTGRISPVVARIAANHEVDLDRVPGTGRAGRITKQDILAYVQKRDSGPGPAEGPPAEAIRETASALSPLAAQTVTAVPEPAGAIPGQVLPLTNVRAAIAEHMVRSKRTSPHVTTVFDVDFSAVTAHRRANKDVFGRDGVNLTFTAYIIAAVVQALKAHPIVNSTWSDEGIVLKREINVGMATAVPSGLIVPVINNADALSLFGLAKSIGDLATRERENRLKPDEVQGGTFTLTNHGVTGSLFATPIINQPQCAILGMGKIEKRVVVIEDGGSDAIAIRPLAYASLTFDHRILDGASADGFMSTFKETIENWTRL